jgi:hypothetical protein
VVNKQERSDAIDHSRLQREISSISLQFIKYILFVQGRKLVWHIKWKKGVRAYRHGAPRSVTNFKWEEVTGDCIKFPNRESIIFSFFSFLFSI